MFGFGVENLKRGEGRKGIDRAETSGCTLSSERLGLVILYRGRGLVCLKY